MSTWKGSEPGAWTFGKTLLTGHGKGTGDFGTSYAVLSGDRMLNGRVSASITLADRHQTGAGLVCRADSAWSFLAFYTAPAEGPPDSTFARIGVFKEGLFVPVAVSAEPVVLSRRANRFSLEFFSGHVRGEIVAGDRTYELSATVPHLPFPGLAGLVKFYRATLQAREFTATMSDIPSPSQVAPPAEYDFDVFLCHSTPDKPVVTELAARLAGAGLTYWLDAERIDFGDAITDAIEQGLSRSRFVLPCFSAGQKQSGWVRAEYQAILNAQFSGDDTRRVVPVLLDDIEASALPVLLRDRKRVSYRNKVEFGEFIQFLRRR
ncbi:toll/interleukin-1 receptor domain-containing protein [Amycolatopsis eburnea]|uniref:Toll/interleukin-1 receptor domain-containing protein n=1 Tax=Amycolatopsis eburnea TaxID=2267691 RepID=A0A3R9F0H5_9PSEU|nr:toll/interleukin-1 receptor domain-containing protein [Amycolatopsis eburnea]RSD10457.1 toll/interleukin-1 receptor domain-containing protein [Amycolatopsis eburnea]